MKVILKYFLLQLILLISNCLYSQVGIGVALPDASSALDVSSSSKGLLMPRLTTVQRDLIVSPAAGLMVFNTTSNDGQVNIGTPLVPTWVGVNPMMYSITKDNNISTSSSSDLLVPDMTVSPELGTYMVSFNGQVSTPFTSAQGVLDMAAIYQEITDLPLGIPHALVFQGGETLTPGVYDVSGAASIGAGTLTLDGGGDPDSIFIIRATGAFSTATTTIVALTNGATSNNIFWMSEVALSTAAGAVMKGSLISPTGAIGLGSNTNLEGRIFTKSGALTTVAGCVITAPSGASPINLGILSTFAMWSSAGAVSDAASSVTNGDTGTAAGTLTMTGSHTGEGYPAGTTVAAITTTTYSIYQNGVEVLNSSRTINSESTVVSLQAIVTAPVAGEVIEVRWKVGTGGGRLSHRNLLLIRSGN